MKSKYKNRIVDDILSNQMKAFGACLIVGPKGCGKTRTAEEKSATNIYFQNPDKKERYDYIFSTQPSKILNFKKPILFDEWQNYKDVWDLIRLNIDKTARKGQYLLTGSTSQKVKTLHTGTLRISKIQMYPMSLYESGESNGTVSLKELFINPRKYDDLKCDLKYEDYAYLTCRGGWPGIFEIKSKKRKLDIAKTLYKQIYESDVESIDKSCPNKILSKQIIDSFSRNICSLVSNKTIYADIKESNNQGNIDRYIYALKQLFIIEEIDAWNANVLSSYAIRSMPKKNLIDPSIATNALNINEKFLADNPHIFGSLFESLVIRDLRVYASKYNGVLNYYRDNSGLECDVVLHWQNGKYALIEIKLGGKMAYVHGIESLNALEQKIKDYNANPKNKRKLALPTFKMLITADETGFYDKNNKTIVVPLGCLKD